MDTDGFELPFLTNLGLMVTYKCSVACPHCIVEAGPHRTQEMLLDQARDWVDQARRYRNGHIQALCLTGGEPFYNLPFLSQISEYGRAKGFIVSVVTNAYWASSPEEARRTLALVPAIQAMTISTDVYHQQAIPFENVRHAVAAARELKRVYTIAVCTDNEQDPGHAEILRELKAMGEGDNVRVAITLPIGRAQQRLQALNYRLSHEPPVTACPVASSPVIFPNGDVIACIGPLLTLPPGHPLFLGNAGREPLAAILDRAEVNPILHAIRVWGPHKLVALLKENGEDGLLPREYISNAGCDACYKLLSDARIVAVLEAMFRSEELMQAVARGRVHYLKETAMAERLPLDGLSKAQPPNRA